MKSLSTTVALAALLAACGGAETQAQGPAPTGSVETRPANAAGQAPAFAGQTRAPAVASKVAYDVQTYAQGLDKPWGLAFLPGGELLVTEKAGRLRIVGKDGKLSEPVTGLPKVDTRGQGGLFGLAVDPNYAKNGLIYFSFADTLENGDTRTAVGRGKLVSDTTGANRLEGLQIIYRQEPGLTSVQHYGGRLVFAKDGTLFVTTGDRSVLPGRVQAQKPDSAIGKMVRINADGSIPKDNPNKPGWRPEIWSIGHRNIQSAALDPQGRLWEVEHGAKGGDELNLVQKGKDYGWPTITYGVEYSGKTIGEGKTAQAGMEQPVYYWDPVIAPSGMAFYNANPFPAWKGSVLVGGLAGKHVARLVLKGGKVTGEERLFTELNERIRDVIVGPDGAVYLATDNAQGRVLRIAPKG